MSPSGAQQPVSRPPRHHDFTDDLVSFGAAPGFDAFKPRLETGS